MSDVKKDNAVVDDNAFARQLLKDNGRDISDFLDDKGNPKVVEAAPGGEAPKPAAAPKPQGGGDGADPTAGEKPAGEDANNGGAPPATAAAEPVVDEDIEDHKLLAALKKRGMNIEKLDDLKPAEKPLTEEEENARKKEVRENAIKYALKEKHITTEELANYNVDAAKSPREIEKDLTKEDAEERFANYFKENLPEDNWERKERQQELNARAMHYFNSKYPNVMDSESTYVEHTQTLELAKAYNKRVEHVFASFPTKETFEIDVDVEGGKTAKEVYTFDFSKESIEAVKNQLLSEESFNRLGKANVDEATLNAIIKSSLLQKEFTNAVKTVARSHANKMVLAAKAGRKGVIPERAGEGTQENNIPGVQSEAEIMLREQGRIK